MKSFLRKTRKSCLLYIFPLLTFFCFFNKTIYGGGYLEENRFQYEKYKWEVWENKDVHIYFPKNMDSITALTLSALPSIIKDLRVVMDESPIKQLNIMIYPSMEALFESNVGIGDTATLPFPTFTLRGNRILVPFESNYELFLKQLKYQYFLFCWNRAMGNIKGDESTSIYAQGCVDWWVNGWSALEEDKLLSDYKTFLLVQGSTHDSTLSHSFFGQLEGKFQAKAFVYFIRQQYGRETLYKVYAILKEHKSLTRALHLATHRSLNELLTDCDHFYRNRWQLFLADSIDASSIKGPLFSTTAIFPENDSLYALENDHHLAIQRTYNEHSLVLIDSSNNKRRKTILDKYIVPPRVQNNDFWHYPLMIYDVKQDKIYSISAPKGKPVLSVFDKRGILLQKGTLPFIDGVSAYSLLGNNHLLLTAFKEGHVALLNYDLQKAKYKVLQSSMADYNQVIVDLPSENIYYRSGNPYGLIHPEDSSFKPYGVYRVQAYQKASESLVFRDSAWIKAYPILDSLHYNGIYIPTGGRSLLLESNDSLNLNTIKTPWLLDWKRNVEEDKKLQTFNDSLSKNDQSSAAAHILKVMATDSSKDSSISLLSYKNGIVKPYKLKLYQAFFSAKINNDYFINNMQPFGAYMGQFKFPDVGAMASGTFTDVFENHRFYVGYRVPSSNDGSDFMIRYDNLAGNLDWYVMGYRKVEALQQDSAQSWLDDSGNPYPTSAKVHTYYFELGFHLPLSYYTSLNGHTAVRSDRTVFLATDDYSLPYRAIKSTWNISSLAWNYNKVKVLKPLIQKGLSASITTQGMISMGKSSTILGAVTTHVSYKYKLGNILVGEVRMQGGFSGGQSHLLYNFGGVDNNLVPRVDSSVVFNQKAPYSFQQLITDLRGYKQNSIYGSRFALGNLDFFIPIFERVFPIHTQISFVKNLQLGIFTDLVTANGQTELNPTKKLLWDYGFGAKTSFAGYGIKFTYGIPGIKVNNNGNVWYLSLVSGI